MAVLTLQCGLWHTVDQYWQMTWQPKSNHLWFVEMSSNSVLDFKELWSCASPLCLQILVPWFPNEIQKWIKDFGPMSNSPVIFLLCPVKTVFPGVPGSGGATSGSGNICAWWLLMYCTALVHFLWSSPKLISLLINIQTKRFLMTENIIFSMIF